MLLWRKDRSVLTHVSNYKHSHLIPAAFESSSQEILIRLQDVNVVVLNQTRIRQPSDSSSVRWDEPCIMYAAQFNVPWVRVPAIARARCILCLPTMQFLHIYTCLLNDPVRSKRKILWDYRNWRWQFYSHNPIPWVVQLISINRIWNLVIGEGFHSANKIQLCKNRWNLNAELQTWDTGGSRQRGGNLDSVELWWEISQNQWPRKSFVKIHPRMTPLRLCLCMFSESGKKLLGTFCNVSDFICLAVSELGWWRQWCKGYLCCG